MARAQSPCKPHSRTVSCTANATATASESKAAKEQQMAHQCRPCLPSRRCRPCRPSLHLSQRRLHAHTPAPCAGLPCRGAVTTGYAQIPAAPLTPRPLHSHTTDGSAQSAHGKQTQHRPIKRTAGSAGSPGNTKDVSTAPIPAVPAAPVGPVAPATPSPMQQSSAASAHAAMPTLGTTPKAPTSSRGSAQPIRCQSHSVAKRVASECGWRRLHAPNTASSPAAPWTP
jgi:hypothetical protein